MLRPNKQLGLGLVLAPTLVVIAATQDRSNQEKSPSDQRASQQNLEKRFQSIEHANQLLQGEVLECLRVGTRSWTKGNQVDPGRDRREPQRDTEDPSYGTSVHALDPSQLIVTVCPAGVFAGAPTLSAVARANERNEREIDGQAAMAEDICGFFLVTMNSAAARDASGKHGEMESRDTGTEYQKFKSGVYAARLASGQIRLFDHAGQNVLTAPLVKYEPGREQAGFESQQQYQQKDWATIYSSIVHAAEKKFNHEKGKDGLPTEQCPEWIKRTLLDNKEKVILFRNGGKDQENLEEGTTFWIFDAAEARHNAADGAFQDDAISAIYVPVGHTVTLFEEKSGSGRQITLQPGYHTATTSSGHEDLNGLNDRVSAIRIQKR